MPIVEQINGIFGAHTIVNRGVLFYFQNEVLSWTYVGDRGCSAGLGCGI